MKTITLDLPRMYGDHHVAEVRRILSAIPAVEDIYASSGFRLVEISYDPTQIEAADLKTALEEAGYLADLDIPSETGEPVYGRETDNSAFRHTMAFEQTQQIVSFGHNVAYSGRPLWPCPGMGPVNLVNGGDDNNG